MNYLRAIAGVFVGIGGLMLIYLGATHGNPEVAGYIIAIGASLMTGLMAFFAGENNGKKKEASKWQS